MRRKTRRRATVSTAPATVIALLDADEKKDLLKTLQIDEQALVERADPQWILQWLTVRRGPFIKMAAAFCGLLSTLEATVSGNIRWIVLHDGIRDLKVDFSPQLRRMVAGALSRCELAGEGMSLDERLQRLERTLCDLSKSLRPGPVSRLSSTGKQMQDTASRLRPGPKRARYEQLARMYIRASVEYHPVDAISLAGVVDRLEKLNVIWQRRPRQSGPSPRDSQHIQRAADVARTKLREVRGRVAMEHPLPPRTGSEAAFTHCLMEIAAAETAVIASSAFEEATNDLVDFFHLELWRQRWRLYELWALARLVRHLQSRGARLLRTNRVDRGKWSLKLSNDTSPVLSLALGDVTLDIYYQLFEKRAGRGQMPDLLVRTTGGRDVLVIDPKHGLSFSRGDLRDVAECYAQTSSTVVSCVIDYFPREPQIDRVLHMPRCVVLYGVQPDHPMELALSREIDSAVQALKEGGTVRTEGVAVAALIDASRSTKTIRRRMINLAIAALSRVPFLEHASSTVMLFGGEVIGSASVEDFAQGALDTSTIADGTSFTAALKSGLEHVRRWSGPREVWMFTDGVGELTPRPAITQFRESGTTLRVWVIETTGSTNVLRTFVDAVQGEYNLVRSDAVTH
jgi:hypothetical protein